MSLTRHSTHQWVASISASASVGNDAPLRPGSNASAATPPQGPPVPAVASFGPGEPFPTVQFISESTRLANLSLDRSKSNWEEWCLQMTLIAD